MSATQVPFALPVIVEECLGNFYLRETGGKILAMGARKEMLESIADCINNHAALVEDSKRLEWLMSRGAYLAHSRDGERCNVVMRYGGDDDKEDQPAEGWPVKHYGDAREAIDAARKAGEGK